jgi:DNA ligase-1
MLADPVADLSTLHYPLLASPKLDGIRAVVHYGQLMSRRFKPIPNREIQAKFGKLPHGWDGELIVGKPTAPNCFQRTSSKVMTIEGDDVDVEFYVFDNYAERGGFVERLNSVHKIYRLEHEKVLDAAEALKYEEEMLAQGYEGIMLRSPHAPYKFGRSTLREQGLLKVKRFLDDEALVIGLVELYSNQNEAKKDAQGFTDRSSHKANMKAMGTLGAIVVSWRGKELHIGTGFTQEMRDSIWKNGAGKIAKFKYLPVGMKDLPRHPVFLGFRDERDM